MSRIRTLARPLALSAALLVGLALSTTLAVPQSSSASGLNRKATVRLYSAGQVVGVWEAEGPGQMEGPSYVFTVLQGAQRIEVRVSGTFSVEEKR